LSGPPMSAHHLLDAYELGQAQAVLLRASEVRVVVSDPHAPTLRYLFRKLKFHGLLHEITPLPIGLWDAEFDQYGYRWGAATGMVDLLPPAGLTRSYPLAVGSDGSWTLGYARLEDNEAILNAVLWDSTATPHVFAERLGIDLGEIVLAQAIGFTSAKDIVGYADEGGVGSLTRGFLARLDE
jgi:hypothetical protein